jgi:Bifunctional DNA primase/polymerase, N-terminal
MSRHTGAPAAGSSLLAAALAAAARGWHVLPLRPDDKRPAFPDHAEDRCTGTDPRCARTGRHVKPTERATVDPDRIRRAWTARPYGIGVACGPSGLLVVDLDRPKPGQHVPAEWAELGGITDGSDVFAVLAERAGALWPATYTVRTGSGGTHLYFTAPPGSRFGNTVGDHGGLGWLIDTRGHGGYVVAAGSTVDSHPYTVTADREPAPLPGWLMFQLTPPAPPAPRRGTLTLDGTGRVPAYLRAALDREAERVTTAAVSGRNHALYIASVALGQLVAGGHLDAAEVTDLLEHCCAGHLAARAFTLSQARRTIASGLRAGAKRPRAVAA